MFFAILSGILLWLSVSVILALIVAPMMSDGGNHEETPSAAHINVTAWHSNWTLAAQNLREMRQRMRQA